MAYQIQSVESPKFDNIFIHLGAFHIEMSFFKVLGKYIEESGGPFILTESLVLPEGSLKGFLTGTHYNRCKRIHTIFSTYNSYIFANIYRFGITTPKILKVKNVYLKSKILILAEIYTFHQF